MEFRRTILATTALVLCVGTAYAGRETGRPSDRIVPRWMNLGVPLHVVNGFPVMVMRGEPDVAPVFKNGPPRYRHAIFDNIDWESKNEKWLKYYGFTILSSTSGEYVSHSYHYKFSETGNNAFPFYGTGKIAKEIGVALASETDASTGSSIEVNIGIYSATASSLPGNEIAGSSATTTTTGKWPLTWAKVDVKLIAGQEYFLEVSCAAGESDCDGAWDESVYAGTDYWHVKEYETYNFDYGKTYTYSYSSPWHETTAINSEGAAVIK
jgi:hypothetical protein